VTHRSRCFTGVGWSTVVGLDDRLSRTVARTQGCGWWRGVGVGIKVHPLECDSDPGLGGVVTRAVEQYQGGVRDHVLHRLLGPLHSTHSSKQKSFSVRGRDGVIGGGYRGWGAERQRERELGSFCKF